MSELDLLRQYLIRLRSERLRNGHKMALAAPGTSNCMGIIICAHEAEFCSRIISALDELEKDSAEFTTKYLQER